MNGIKRWRSSGGELSSNSTTLSTVTIGKNQYAAARQGREDEGDMLPREGREGEWAAYVLSGRISCRLAAVA